LKLEPGANVSGMFERRIGLGHQARTPMPRDSRASPFGRPMITQAK